MWSEEIRNYSSKLFHSTHSNKEEFGDDKCQDNIHINFPIKEEPATVKKV